MTDYTELIKALRYCTSSNPDDCDICEYQPFCQRNGTGRERIMIDAAAAIEELDAEETRLLLITSELQDKVVELEEELNDADIAADDNARQIEELQAEVKRLKECNDELREAQTYIDKWGTRWGTSAKDVPDSAYKHGYADGKYEALTLEECIDRLHELGWLQEHDKILSQPHWVSVEDRKPEPNTDIVFIAKYGDTYEIDIGSMSKAREWWGYESWHSDENVIYWMPLPEPPKEDA